ncbi:MAG TPA: PEP-CTERM sorting domain-containing protein [Verrucomicrobiales bacterium]|nr:PEP-CTERM sorting domain-containing protein [Verrucomicrobiales bacterium]
MRIYTILPLFALALTGISSGAGYSTNFNSGYDSSQAVAGQNGWTINDSTTDLSFFVTYNTTDAAAIGGYYTSPALGNVRLSHSLSLPLVQTSLGADFAIVPSTVTFPGRDTFGWSVYNGSGLNLLTIQFEPDSVNQTLLNITWSTGAGSATTTGWAVQYDGPYSLQVAFASGGGSDATFTASITGANTVSFNGSLPGMANETVGSIGQHFVQQAAAAGDNYMLFDNLSVVPEPSTGALLLTLLMLPLAARRRKAAF